jgi:hypothetical protein
MEKYKTRQWINTKRGLKTNILPQEQIWAKGLAHEVQARLRIPDTWCELYRQWATYNMLPKWLSWRGKTFGQINSNFSKEFHPHPPVRSWWSLTMTQSPKTDTNLK